MVLKVSLLEVSIWRLRRAMCEQLQRVGSFSVVVPLVASMSFRFHSPVYHLVPVAALPNLPVPNVMSGRRRHGCIIRHTHNVLSQPIEAMIDVIETESLIFSVVLSDDGLTNQFLQRN
jgi:hypothetical protein